MRHLTLTEFQTTEGVDLSHEEVAMLQTIAPSISITPSRQAGKFDLKPGAHIGAIALPTIYFLVRPKLEMSRLMFVLSYAVDPRQWRDVGFEFEEDQTLFEAILPGYVFQLRRSLRRGLLRGYVPVEETSISLRGRLRFGDQISRRYGRSVPAEIAFDDYTEDVFLNRLLKAALRAAARMPLRSSCLRRRLRAFDLIFRDVSDVEFDPRRVPVPGYTRLDEHLRPAVDLARLILQASSFQHRRGEVHAAAFLVDMNHVFEEFVVVALREALALSAAELVQGRGNRALKLDRRRRIGLAPDLAWWRSGQCIFVGDVKYKRLSLSGYIHADVYQLLAYAIATELRSAMLVYAQGEAEATAHDVPFAGKTLLVRTLDLSREPEDILQQVGRLADEIRDRANDPPTQTSAMGNVVA